jgi:hypothetical protein
VYSLLQHDARIDEGFVGWIKKEKSHAGKCAMSVYFLYYI